MAAPLAATVSEGLDVLRTGKALDEKSVTGHDTKSTRDICQCCDSRKNV